MLALTRPEQSLPTFTDLQDVRGTATTMADFAYLFLIQGQNERVLQLLAATYGQVERAAGVGHVRAA